MRGRRLLQRASAKVFWCHVAEKSPWDILVQLCSWYNMLGGRLLQRVSAGLLRCHLAEKSDRERCIKPPCSLENLSWHCSTTLRAAAGWAKRTAASTACRRTKLAQRREKLRMSIAETNLSERVICLKIRSQKAAAGVLHILGQCLKLRSLRIAGPIECLHSRRI